MDRARDLPTWPHSDRSRFVRHRPHDWHVQEMGAGPAILFLHGAGASTHTWRDILPRLAPDWRAIALDLPGQGFTRAGARRRMGLDAMTEDILALCADQDWRPAAIVGHSAGAAIALALSRRMPGAPAVVGINAALGHFTGIASWLFPLLAKLLAMNPLTAAVFTLGGPSPSRARRLIEGTGSRLDAAGVDLYARLMADRAHVDGTLQMMTQWRIDPLLADLPTLRAPTLLIAGSADTAVPPETSDRAARDLPNARVARLDGLGHLAHEEAPDRTADLVADFLSSLTRRGNSDPDAPGGPPTVTRT